MSLIYTSAPVRVTHRLFAKNGCSWNSLANLLVSSTVSARDPKYGRLGYEIS